MTGARKWSLVNQLSFVVFDISIAVPMSKPEGKGYSVPKGHKNQGCREPKKAKSMPA